MKNLIDTLLEDIQNNWDAEYLGQFLCNIYALGRLDEEVNRESEDAEILFLMSPLLNSTTVLDYINIRLDEYVDEIEELEKDEEDWEIFDKMIEMLEDRPEDY